MIIIMKNDATPDQRQVVLKRIEEVGRKPHLSEGERKTIIGAVGNGSVSPLDFQILPGVENVVPIMKPFKLASREFRPENSVVTVRDIAIGGERVVVMAGPCAVESEEQTMSAARAVRKAGARILRGGAFKPRTSPYSFQGMREDGLKILAKAREETGLAIVTEVIAPEYVDLVAEYADILQVGARNVQNFPLLEAVGNAGKPVLLKRGMMSTVEELLMSAEYILATGNKDVLLCERGIRSFEKYTRNTLDISAIPVIKELSHLPVIVDPSHATGKRNLVAPATRGAVAAGADGLIIEVHPDPDTALCDGIQSLDPKEFSELMETVANISAALGRSL